MLHRKPSVCKSIDYSRTSFPKPASVFACLSLTLFLSTITIAAETFHFQKGATGIAGVYTGATDTYLRENMPTATPGQNGDLLAGYESVIGGGKARTLIRFDLTDLKSGWQTTPATQISGARLSLRFYGVLGTPFVGKSLKLYRVSAANKGWVAGTATSAGGQQEGAACWNFKTYNPTKTAATAPCPSCVSHTPWESDSATWSPVNESFGSATKGRGCGVSDTDYVATEVASAIISSSQVNSWVTFTFTDLTFLASWVNNHSDNGGFLISCPELEVGTSLNYSLIKFASSENLTPSIRPIFDIDLNNFGSTTTLPGGIRYTLPSAGKVSMHISDASGKVVKELLFGARRNAGQNVEFWDCKDDPVPQKSDTAQTVPSGVYTVKILQTQGLMAQYLLSAGTSGNPWNVMPGNVVAPNGFAVDSSGLYISSALSHLAPSTVRIKLNTDSVLTTYVPLVFKAGAYAMATPGNDTLYMISLSGQYCTMGKIPASALVNKIYCPPTSVSEAGFAGDFNWDIAARKGNVAVANYSDSAQSFCWIDPITGVKIGTPISVPGLCGITMDLTGNVLVCNGTAILRYVKGSAVAASVVSSDLVAADHIDVNPSNGDIYVIDLGTSMQVKVFTNAGVLKKTLGTAGGVKLYGAYNPADGWRIDYSIVAPQLRVAADGSFYIGTIEPVKKIARYDSNGVYIKEWYSSGIINIHASPEPDNPTRIWIEQNYNNVMRAEINYATKTWKIIGNYRTNKGIFSREALTSAQSGHWQVVKRGGKIYLVSDQFPTVMYFDEAADSLKYIAAGGCEISTAGDSIAFSMNPNADGTWADLNGDGNQQPNEVTASTSLGDDFFVSKQTKINVRNSVDSNFTAYGAFYKAGVDSVDTMIAGETGFNLGPAVYQPQLITVNGYTVPQYNLATQIKYPYSGSNWPAERRMLLPHGGFPDGKGNIYSAYSNEYGPYMTDRSYAILSGSLGGITIAKTNMSTGKYEWVVGKFSPYAYPGPGEMVPLNRIVGPVRNCVVAISSSPVQTVYNEKGLYVGNFFDTKSPTTLPADGILVSGDQIGGSVYEVTRTDIPGLTRGDVLFFGSAINSINVFKISGFDSFVSMDTTISVQSGRISGSVGIRNPAVKNGVNSISLSIKKSAGTLICYSVPARADVKLEVFSVMGQRTVTLVDRSMDVGGYAVSVTPGMLKAGFYLVRLSVGGDKITQSMVIIR